MSNVSLNSTYPVDPSSFNQPFPLMTLAGYQNIWQGEILKHLSLPDIANLKESCKTFNQTIGVKHYNPADLSQKIEVVNSRIWKLGRRVLVYDVHKQRDPAEIERFLKLSRTQEFLEKQLIPQWRQNGERLALELFEGSVLEDIYELDYAKHDRSQDGELAFMPFNELESIVKTRNAESDSDKNPPFIKGECNARPFFSLLIQNTDSCSAITIYENKEPGNWYVDIQTPQFIEGQVPDEVWHSPFIEKGKITNQKMYGMLKALFSAHNPTNHISQSANL
ncbi:hypothetical protein [Candidatus Protochlamydia phocaeensis]|uniref:hypothetical protein n=1 Tax=Candidatus Protochlamydia phocaeensis TaxID=1414722 RepID=UPI0008398BE2|nr:hypothetical protein [Candidatus Protochlamydia phocaeensis]